MREIESTELGANRVAPVGVGVPRRSMTLVMASALYATATRVSQSDTYPIGLSGRPGIKSGVGEELVVHSCHRGPWKTNGRPALWARRLFHQSPRRAANCLVPRLPLGSPA